MEKTVDSNELVYFCAASKGIELVKCEFMKKRQKAQIPFQNKSRSKRRYQAYLEYGDGFNSFLDFLYFLDSLITISLFQYLSFGFNQVISSNNLYFRAQAYAVDEFFLKSFF